MTTAKIEGGQPGIYAKILAIQDAVGTIPKNGRGPSSKGGFEFVKFDDVLLGVRNQLVAQKIIRSVKTLEHTVRVDFIKDRAVTNTSVLVEYTYIDTVDGSTHVSIVGGEGSDVGGDTATRKAYTQALKIELLQTLSIVTGEDVDSDGMTHPDPVASPATASATTSAAKSTTATSESPVKKLQSEITGIVKSTDNPYTSVIVNALGDRISGVERKKWFESVEHLTKIRDAILNGEVA